ncbi:hypothetical protein GEMRC1_006589 [Eukaryota sp. GEM-RC1]
MSIAPITVDCKSELIGLTSLLGLSSIRDILTLPMIDSQIISNHNQWSFLSQSTGHCTFSLVFRASDHLFRASAFREVCKGISPIVVIISTTENDIIGGYSTKPFSKNGPTSSPEAFLFVLKRRGTCVREKYDIKKGQERWALYSSKENGPCFSGDLKISNNCDQNPSLFKNGSYESRELLSSENFLVSEYEVFICN